MGMDGSSILMLWPSSALQQWWPWLLGEVRGCILRMALTSTAWLHQPLGRNKIAIVSVQSRSSILEN